MELLPAIFTFYNIVFHFELIKYIFLLCSIFYPRSFKKRGEKVEDLVDSLIEQCKWES